MRLTPRRRLLVDNKVQMGLIFRVVAYWCFCVIAIGLMLVALEILDAPDGDFFSYFRFDRVWNSHGVVLLAALVLLPAILMDVLRFSNRFAGPVYRLRRSMRALGAGEFVAPIKFRDRDYWPELADEFNAIAAYIDSLKQRLAAADGENVSVGGEPQAEALAHN
jgi:hypothetical protein